MTEENGSTDFILGAAMGVGCGLMLGVVVVAALVYFAPDFLGILRPLNQSAEVSPSLAAPGAPSKASPFLR